MSRDYRPSDATTASSQRRGAKLTEAPYANWHRPSGQVWGRDSQEPGDCGTLVAQGCFLVGDPAFYRRFGFEHNPGLRMEGIPPEVNLCLPMGDRVPEGNVTRHPAFSVGE